MHRHRWVRDVRDQICALSGLSKQEIAKALGVDRRSLSGWVSGQTRPDEEHLRRLERLLTLVTDIERAHPTQSGAILRSLTLGGDTLLDLLAQGRYLEIRAWCLLLATLPGPPKGRFPLSRSPVAAPARISNPESIREPLVTQALDRTPRGPRRIPVPSPSPVSRPTP
jgi:transcriptional regulator with XRE-family HTH domain